MYICRYGMMENQKKKLGAKGMKIWRGAVGGRGQGINWDSPGQRKYLETPGIYWELPWGPKWDVIGPKDKQRC
jgi:hypothetical protein